VSVDGFIADALDRVGPLFDWYSNGVVARPRPTAKVSQVSADYVTPIWVRIGSMVGKYWRSRPFVFSFDGRSQGRPG
jgi:hypothetical protein